MQIYSPRKKKGKIVGFFILTLFFAAGGVLVGYSFIRGLPSPERITERAITESTKIYDRNQKVILYEIHGEEKRTVIALSQIPKHVREATLAAEDIHFYQHPGLDWRGIIRAALINILKGDIRQGGSTITQQVAKNSLLGWSERKIFRKIREQIMALAIERKYSKDEILEIYLNQIPYGSNSYGIAAASRTFFSKEADNLTLTEAAILAALPKAPTYYSPYGSHKEALFLRKDRILDRMKEAGFISAEELLRAQNEKVVFSPPRQELHAPHFALYIREYLNQKYGEEFIERGGLKVITTLDMRLQEIAEQAVRAGAERNQKLVDANNSALVALDPRSGEILALVGSKNFFGKPEPEGCRPGLNCKFDPHVNVAMRARQPGSTFKPFVYAAAFKKGFTPETVLFDVPTEFNPLCNPDGTPGPRIEDPKECYHPQNYDEKFRGPVSLRQALAQSLNVPSVKVLYLAGVNDSIKIAKDLGITTISDPNRYSLSLVLGGAEVTLLEMTSAFGVFAREGILNPPTAILRIENSKGEVLEEKKETARPVLDTEIAKIINDILSDNDARVPVFNPQSSLYFPERAVAAKTGTTQNFRDAWVIGYTPSLVVGVWSGNNDNSPMNKLTLSVIVSGPIWHEFLAKALENSPSEEFIKPRPQRPEKLTLRGQYRSDPVIKVDKISRKLATSYTPEELIEEVALGKIQSILSLIRKEEPLGPPPENPEDDPQFKNWQEGIERWLAVNPLPEPKAPHEFDDIHTPKNHPQIRILDPEGSEIYGNPDKIRVEIKSTFPVNEISLFIDDILEDTQTSPIAFKEIILKPKSLIFPGSHKIKITAYDVVGNKGVLEKEIIIIDQ